MERDAVAERGAGAEAASDVEMASDAELVVDDEEAAMTRLAELRLERLEALKVGEGPEWFVKASAEELRQVARDFDRLKRDHHDEIMQLQAILDDANDMDDEPDNALAVHDN